MIQCALPGTRQYQERLYPNPALLDPCTRLKLKSYVDVITHLTASSLAEEHRALSSLPGSTHDSPAKLANPSRAAPGIHAKISMSVSRCTWPKGW